MFLPRLHTSIFFPEPLSTLHHQNLVRSKVRRIQLFLGVAKMEHHRSQNNRSISYAEYYYSLGYQVIVRIDEKEAMIRSLMAIKLDLDPIATYIYAIIFGNEPDHEPKHYDLTWRTQTGWGNNVDADFPRVPRLDIFRMRLEQGYTLLSTLIRADGRPVLFCSPGLSHQKITEDDPAQPGQATWYEYCRMILDRCDMNGGHIYEHNWFDNAINGIRAKATLDDLARDLHKEIWINENNINRGNDVEQIRAFIDFQQTILLTKSRNSSVYLQTPNGERVTHHGLFCGNGLANHYDEIYIVVDPQAYEELGAWMDNPLSDVK